MTVKISLSEDEASKFYMLLKSELSEHHDNPLIKRLLKKLDETLPKKAKDSAFAEYLSETFEENPWAELPGTKKAFAIIQKALNSGNRALLKYYSMSSGLTEREISPIEINSKYFTAFCHLRNEERQFRVGRIVSARILNKRVSYEEKKPKH